MTTDSWFAYLCGAVTALITHPTGWVMCTPAGWATTAALCERGGYA